MFRSFRKEKRTKKQFDFKTMRGPRKLRQGAEFPDNLFFLVINVFHSRGPCGRPSRDCFSSGCGDRKGPYQFFRKHISTCIFSVCVGGGRANHPVSPAPPLPLDPPMKTDHTSVRSVLPNFLHAGCRIWSQTQKTGCLALMPNYYV